jgi:thiol-disulfide isomerase/thioredoxin
MERPFAGVRARQSDTSGSAFLFGLGLGLVYVPCAGPVLAAITVLGARHAASLDSVVLSLVFSLGAVAPLVALAFAGDALVARSHVLRDRARQLRPLAGALLLATSLLLATNAVAGLQRWLPSYTSSLQRLVEGNSYVVTHLRSLEHNTGANGGSLVDCENAASAGVELGLHECGLAPEFKGITAWLNTPDDRPLTLAGLRGHVVLIDFWTYSCINCQRSLPHVEAWWRDYHRDGLEVIGVEAPEFAFEHDVSNIAAAAKSLGVVYPIAVDDNLATWSAWDNEYWPAEYLIDAKGVVRHVAYGEGDYGADETLLRQLLVQAHPGLHLPPPTSVPDRTPTEATSPETYLGTERSQYLDAAVMTNGAHQAFIEPAHVPLGEYGLGGWWTPSPEFITAGRAATLDLDFEAKHVYLVLGGQGTVRVHLAGGATTTTVKVGGYPTLYTLFNSRQSTQGTLDLSFTKGIQAYDFTFG